MHETVLYHIYGKYFYYDLTEAIEQAKRIVRSRVRKEPLEEKWVTSVGKKGGICVKNLDKDWSKIGNSALFQVVIISKKI